MKTKLLLVLIISCALNISAQTQKDLAKKYLDYRGELVFTFTANNIQEASELSNIITFDHGIDPSNPLVIRAIANKKNFPKFLEYNLKYEVDIQANEPKNVVMFNPEIHKKGASSKSNSYTLSFPLSTYPTYQQYADQMQNFVDDHSDIAELVDIGGTVQGDKRLLFIKLSDNVSTREAEPRVMYTSSMHGDEIAGFPAMLNLIDYFITAYKDTGHSDHTRIKNLIDNSEVWINPMANPDATYWLSSNNTSVANSRRENANDVDLNRNYPDNVGGTHPDGEVYQTETQNFMQFATDYHFVLSANLHGGIELVNYPFDNAYASTTANHTEDPSDEGPFYTHPDTDWFEYVSVEFASQAQDDSDDLGETSYMTVDYDSYIYPSPGVTHGAEWYRVYGGRQDYMNFYHQCREITIEISDDKTPSATNTSSNNEVIDIWNYNQEAYIKFLIQGTYGFRGIVKDATTGTPIEAKITIVGRDDKETPITNSWVKTETLFAGTEAGLGDFYRPIEAGTYDILIEADCYAPVTLSSQSISNYQTVDLGDINLTPANPVPSNLSATSITATTATLNWDNAGVDSYDIQYRVVGASTWINASSTTNSLDLTGLSLNTTYEFQVSSVCSTSNSNYSSTFSFLTLIANYCDSDSNDDDYISIGNVELNTINNMTDDGNTSTGYSDYTSISTSLDLGTQYTITLTPNRTNNYSIGYAAWIDYNNNGDFDDANEEIFSQSATSNSSVSGSFTVPTGISLVSTRMRVSVKYNSTPTSCENINYGEVEDYTINIVDTTLSIENDILNQFTIYPNPSTASVVNVKLPNTVRDFTISMSSILGKQVYSEKVNTTNSIHTIETANLNSGVYFVTIQTEQGKATKKLIIQ